MIKRRALRAMALFLAVETLLTAIVPPVSLALTAGPTVPEATSFEPVDTTDMINLSSGDFTYNIPLIDVPGPAGSYPLGLSYHAGIQPNEDASWVGLGWTLNPGAITRNVNGYADDHKDVANVDRKYWSGGERHTYNVGVSLGAIGGANSPASVSFGLSFSQDTYKGFGVGGYVGLGASIFRNESGTASLGIGGRVGISPYGGAYASSGMNVGLSKGEKSAMRLGLGVNASTQGGVGLSGGISTRQKTEDGRSQSYSLLGASISSKGTKPSLSLGGASASIHNGNAGKIRTSSSSFGVDIPVMPGVSVSLGYGYLRYWSDERAEVLTNGTLYNPSSVNIGTFEDRTFDSYTLFDPGTEGSGIVDNPDSEQVLGGTLPNYDNYTVNAQGVSGSMRPHMLQKILYRQHKKDKDGNYLVKQYPLFNSNTAVKPVQFRFIGDFSNRYKYEAEGIDVVTGNPALPLNYTFDNIAETGENGNDGYNSVSNHLDGSKHVQWFSNEEIINGSARSKGFVDCTVPGFDRNTSPADQIGGYMITNESGVVYHFALPAYSYDELVYTENIEKGDGHTFNSLSKPEKYAYTWFLTAVTGPDYVDRNPEISPGFGKASNGDWGYWVTFNYGLWADNYKWRNPSEGWHMDLDNNFKSYSSGKKELYYLNSIATQTHTAIMVKEIRADGKGKARYIDEDGFKPYESLELYRISNCTPDPQEQEDCERYFDVYNYPTSTLKLNKIILIDNERLDETAPYPIRQLSDNYEHSFTFNNGETGSDYEEVVQNVHYGDNVIDIYDMAEVPGVMDNAIRAVSLEHDYSLSPNTVNSFDEEGSIYTQSPSSTAGDVKKGKLTLNTLKFLGKNGSDVLPGTNFTYELTSPEQGFATVLKQGDNFSLEDTEGHFNPGDIITYEKSGEEYYCFVGKEQGFNKYSLFYVGKSIPTGHHVNVLARTTKNPPYNRDLFDLWGLYKPDYLEIEENHNLSRLTTPQSAKATDAWSLRQIESSLGAVIDVKYEPDSYHESVLYKNHSLIIDSFEDRGNGEFKVNIDTYGNDLQDKFEVGHHVDLIVLTQATGTIYIADPFATQSSRDVETPTEILEVGEDYLILTNSEFYDLIYIYSQYIQVKPKGGNISFDTDHTNYGGGLRVEGIKVTDPISGRASETNYDYRGRYSNGQITSGITSYEPVGLDRFKTYGLSEEVLKDYKKELYKEFEQLLFNASEAPSPAVMYEYVTVTEKVTDEQGKIHKVPSHSVYQFQPFHKRMLGIQQNEVEVTESNEFSGSTVSHGIHYARSKTRNVRIKDFTTQAGSLKKISLYDNNGDKISETINHYLHDDAMVEAIDTPTSEYENALEKYNYQGVLQETFADGRFVRKDDGTYELYGIVSQRELYPSIQTGVTNINYKTGIKTTTTTKEFDFYSGQVIASLTQDGYGNEFWSKKIPAYKIYPQMGLKSANPNNKHMLSQQSGSYEYKLNDSGNITLETIDGPLKADVVKASTQTWSDQWLYRDQESHLPITSMIPGGVISTQWTTITFTATQPHRLKQGDYINLVEIDGNGDVIKQQKAYLSYPVYENSNTVQVAGEVSHPYTHIEKISNVWRKEGTFVYRGDELNEDGTHKNFVDFNWSDPFALEQNNSQWQKNGEITLYDQYSHALEATDINGHFASTKMNSNKSMVYATASNARYAQFGFSGAEDEPDFTGNFGGEVQIGDGTVFTDSDHVTHTGSNGLKLNSDEKGFIYNIKASELGVPTHYRASAWIHQDNIANGRIYVKEGSTVLREQAYMGEGIRKSGEWYHVEAVVSATGQEDLEIGCKNIGSGLVYFDDFRCHPVNAQMSSYVYNKDGEVSHILDANNMFTEYRYDAMGRLTNTYKESFKYGVTHLSKVAYNYGRKFHDRLDQLDDSFTVGNNRIAGDNIHFQGNSHSHLEGNTTFSWEFGDGSQSNTTATSRYHSYDNGGLYKVKLAVENPNYGGKQSIQMIRIYDDHPEINICANGPVILDECGGNVLSWGDCTAQGNTNTNQVSFNASIDRSSGNSVCPIATYEWEYQRGSGNMIGLGSGSISDHLDLNASGTYTIYCTATDECGGTITQTFTVTILGDGPNCGTVE